MKIPRGTIHPAPKGRGFSLPLDPTVYKREQPVHNIIHEFKNIVKSATHTHFGDRCAEWVILQGDNESIKQFVERISAVKDVMVCRCSV